MVQKMQLSLNSSEMSSTKPIYGLPSHMQHTHHDCVLMSASSFSASGVTSSSLCPVTETVSGEIV